MLVAKQILFLFNTRETIREPFCVSNRVGFANPEPLKMALFVTIVRGFEPLIFVKKSFILDRLGFKVNNKDTRTTGFLSL